MRRLYFGRGQCAGRQVRYYILAETLERELEVYGALVEMGEETAELPALTASRREAEEFLRLLARGAVTPMAARDVAEDWLER